MAALLFCGSRPTMLDIEQEAGPVTRNAEVSPLTAGLLGHCSLGDGSSMCRPKPNPMDVCTHCGLDYKFVDTGDGPAVFAIFILGFLCVGGALIAEFKFGVAPWMHVVLWGFLTPLLAVFLLRFLKATLIALQFKNKAEEGRLSKD